jgi:hypothetical protein
LSCRFGLLPALYALQHGHLSILLAHLEDVEGVLLLDLHHGTSQLDAFVEVLENLLLDSLHLLLLVNPAAIGTDTVTSHGILGTMATLNSWQLITVILLRGIGRAIIG